MSTERPELDPATAGWAALAAARREQLRAWLRAVSSPAPVERAEALLAQDPEVRRLARDWDGLDAASRQAAAPGLDAAFRRAAYATRPSCLRCGACCTQAGPTLHPPDLDLVRRGVLGLDRLVTHRPGEEVHDHWQGRRRVLEHELVTVAPAAGGACPFYSRVRAACTIHEQRPVQCEAQRCWDTAASDRLNRRPGLTRRDLLGPDHPLLPLLQEHDRLCPARTLTRLREQARGPDGAGAHLRLAQLATEDSRLRLRALELEPSLSGALELLFGRPWY